MRLDLLATEMCCRMRNVIIFINNFLHIKKLRKEVSMRVKVKLTLEQATKAQRGSRGKALLFLNLITRWWVVNATLRPV
jgi:hypothetical protein